MYGPAGNRVRRRKASGTPFIVLTVSNIFESPTDLCQPLFYNYFAYELGNLRLPCIFYHCTKGLTLGKRTRTLGPLTSHPFLTDGCTSCRGRGTIVNSLTSRSCGASSGYRSNGARQILGPFRDNIPPDCVGCAAPRYRGDAHEKKLVQVE